MGTTGELRLDVERIRRIGGLPFLADDLERWQLEDALTFLSSVLIGLRQAAELAKSVPLDTEDRPRLEFSDLGVFQAAFTIFYAARNLELLLPDRRSLEPWLVDLATARLPRYHDTRGLALQGLIHEAHCRFDLAAAAYAQALRLDLRNDLATYEIEKFRLKAEGGR